MLGRQNHDDLYVPSLAANHMLLKQYVLNVLLLALLFAMVVIADAAILREFTVKVARLSLLVVEACLTTAAGVYAGIATVVALFFDFL